MSKYFHTTSKLSQYLYSLSLLKYEEQILKTPKLVLTKTCSVDSAVPGDIITYMIVVENISNILLKNIVITDKLPYELHFINNSLKINNKILNKTNITLGLNIGSLIPNSKITITFNVIVQSSNSHIIFTKCNALYKFTSLYNKDFLNLTESNSNKICIKYLEIKTSKFNITRYIKLPPLISNIDTIKHISCIPKIISHNITEASIISKKSTIYEHEFRLSFLCTLSCSLCYISSTLNTTSFNFNINFNSSIPISPSFDTSSIISITPLIENLYYEYLSKRVFLQDLDLLITIKKINR